MDTESQVREYLDSAHKMYEKGQIEAGDYHKILTSLAYEYLEMDKQQLAFAVLNRIDPEYFAPGGVQIQQAQADKQYAELIVRLAHRLLQLGLVGADIDLYNATQKPARA